MKAKRTLSDYPAKAPSSQIWPSPMLQEGEDGLLKHDGLTAEQLEHKAQLLAAEEDRSMISEFRRRLDYNMGRVRSSTCSLECNSALCQ